MGVVMKESVLGEVVAAGVEAFLTGSTTGPAGSSSRG